MLPSTGYFKAINCPFYENGLCDRPYCHFKHAKRAGELGVAASATNVGENQTTVQNETLQTTTTLETNPELLRQLVTDTVKKVLADKDISNATDISENIISHVVENLKPTLSSISSKIVENTVSSILGKHANIPTTIVKPKPSYNPTPIAELKKRHLPVVSYMPTRESKVAVKRKTSPERVKPWLAICKESNILHNKEITYKPTAITNTVSSSNSQDSLQGYVPTSKSNSPLSSSHEDSNSNDYFNRGKEAYYPKSKKRREEYVPKMVKTPLKAAQNIDDSVLDDYKPEFDMIDEILTTGTNTQNTKNNSNSIDWLDEVGIFSDDDLAETTSRTPSDENILVSENEKIENVLLKQSQEKIPSNDENDQCNRQEVKSDSTNSVDKSKSKDEKNKSHSQSNNKSSDKHRDKSKESSKRDSDKTKSKDSHRSKNKIEDKSKDSKSRTEKHRSHSSEKHHKSSHSRSKDRNEHSSKKSHKNSESEKDRKSSRRSSEKDDKYKSSKNDKHKSSLSKSKGINKSTSHRSSSSKKSTKTKSNCGEDSAGENDNESNDFINNLQSPIYDEIMLSDSDHDVEEECLKIFQEYQINDKPKVVSVKEIKPEIEESEDVGRKRVAHPSATTISRPVAAVFKKVINPQQKMLERWRMMKEATAVKIAEKAPLTNKAPITLTLTKQSAAIKRDDSVETTLKTGTSDHHVNGNGKIRIAHVPYAMSLALEKKKVVETVKKAAIAKPIENKTAAQTNKGIRVAHVPQIIPQLVRPEPLQAATQKFPLNVRQYYINLMHDICVQIYTNSEDAAQRAVREEIACHDRCKALPVYKNSCMLALHRLRKEMDQNPQNDMSESCNSSLVSHEAVLAGKTKGSWSVVKTKKAATDFKGSTLYNMLTKWIMSEDLLQTNGFPRPHPDGPKGRAKIYVINSRNQNVLSKVPNERICSRCGQAYLVDKHGLAVQQKNCIYHWGRKFTMRGESKYSCCQQYGSASGCCDAKCHVWDYTDYENLRGYVRTLPKDIVIEEQGVYALDCEMCYTTQGLELTRVTVINDDCKVIYETLVKPMNPIIDYNTRFSGITEESMANVTTSLLDVQATLLTMFSDKTILIGHSLESDFKALRLLHDTVVDTSVMFPHKNGPPHKRALRNLCSEYLRKIIQNDIGGHDSKEDAVSCMELIHWKVREEAKLL